jgi:hypothetical protein
MTQISAYLNLYLIFLLLLIQAYHNTFLSFGTNSTGLQQCLVMCFPHDLKKFNVVYSQIGVYHDHSPLGP